MRLPFVWTLSLVLLLSAFGCEDGETPVDEPRPMTSLLVPMELASTWDLFPHRFSRLELSMENNDAGGVVRAETNGGSWGVVDTPRVRYGVEAWQSRALAFEEVSIEIAIPPQSEADGEPFAVRQELRAPAESLAGAGALVAIIRGFRISADEYDERPDFESDSELPYEAIDGFTSQGLAFVLGEPSFDDDEIVLDVTARNNLGLADRGDMNNAIPQATTWVRVDAIIIGAFGAGAAESSGDTSYYIGAAEYGANTVHDHAPDGEQLIELTGAAGAEHALFGLQAVEFWLNVDGHHASDCVVVHDEINSWDEEISGPGRYIRELSFRLWNSSYDAASGVGSINADLMLTNSSTFKEVGNLCLEARATVGMLQFSDVEAVVDEVEAVEMRLDPAEGEPIEEAVEL